MADWREMGADNREAAKELLLSGRYRSCVSRCYYAAYCAVTAFLDDRVDFAYEGNNPTHEVLERLIMNNLYESSQQERYFLRKQIKQLRTARVYADYVTGDLTTESVARDAVRSASAVLRLLTEDR